jgi:hypothetical protein
MKKYLIAVTVLLTSSFYVFAQQGREGTAEEKAAHAKNVKGIMGSWKTIATEIKIAEPELKAKQADVEKIYKNLFGSALWEFAPDGQFALVTSGSQTEEKGTFLVTAQFLTLYLTGKTYRCLMKVEDDGKVIIHFPITEKSIYAIQLEKL